MKKQTKNTILVFSILAVAIFFLAGGEQLFSVFQAPIGWQPYGESGDVITGLSKIDSTHYTSTYWDIESTQQQIIGDDFFLKSETNGGNNLKFTTKNTFGKGKKFRAVAHVSGGFSSAYQSAVQIKLITPTKTISGYDYGEAIGNSQQNLLEIKSSPLIDEVQIYFRGQLVNTLQVSEDFRIEISMQVAGTPNDLIRVGLENPAYKDVYNCQVKPDEQYYKFYFMEGSTVSKAQLPNHNKWCLDTSPLEIYTNAGKTTDSMVLVALENGNSYPVPSGQIWAIEYIGDKKNLTTPCEQNEVLLNGNECKARTVLELQFLCEGGVLNTATGECIPLTSNVTPPPITLQTQPVDYIQSDIQTYQFLADNSKFRFTHIKDDNTETASSFDLLGKMFISEIPVSFTSDAFSYGDKSGTLFINDIAELDERLKVKLSRIELQDPADVGVGDTQKFLVEWTFELDTSFLVPSYDASKKEIVITNNYYPFTGGISITKKDNSGVSKTETKFTSFALGETRIPIETAGLLEFRVRPFIEISTPDAEFRLVGAIPMTVSDLQETQAIISVPTQPTTTQPIIPLEKTPEGGKGIESQKKEGISFGLVAIIIGGVLAGFGMVYFLIRRLVKPRWRK